MRRSISVFKTGYKPTLDSSAFSATNANAINANKASNAPIVTRIIPQSLDTKEHVIKYGLSTLMAPLAPFWFFSVNANHRAVVTNFGKYKETIPEGLHWRSPVGLKSQSVFVGKVSHDLKKSTIVDSNGNPVNVSGTVNYSIVDPEKYVINIDSNSRYLNNQAEIVLKRVTSEYPYESKSGESLTKEGKLISNRMTTELQKLVEVAGIQIDEFYLTDIKYAPEIATHMLIRQRALAYVDAKDTIGKASVGIVKQIIEDVENTCNVTLSNDRKGQIIDHLLVVMTSETGVQPVMNLDSSQEIQHQSNGSTNDLSSNMSNRLDDMKEFIKKLE